MKFVCKYKLLLILNKFDSEKKNLNIKLLFLFVENLTYITQKGCAYDKEL